MAVVYTAEEIEHIKHLASLALSNKEIAIQCNTKFHVERPIRTGRGIEYAAEVKLSLSKRRFEKKCEVCHSVFKTSWPQARYCSEECKAVIDREFANKKYRLNPALNISVQTKQVRMRMEARWHTILKKFNNQCQRCKQSFPVAVYDLHHPHGKRSRQDTPSRVIRGGTDKAFEKLISETVLLCANCHRLTHAETGNWAPGRNDI